MTENTGPIRPEGEIVLYQPQEGSGQIRVLLEGQTVWLTQAMIADLFQTSVPNVNIHLKNIYEEGELNDAATVKEYLIVRREASRQVSRKVLHYNLDAILGVGYRVKSSVATRFRQWATARLREYIVKGFTLDDEPEHWKVEPLKRIFVTLNGSTPKSGNRDYCHVLTTPGVPRP
ncbi:MAG: virulence RhuM family protein [Phycisphaerae bacterium]|nr:virulence RhuM family protein [Phycisphaerae bacterium]